jgi:hypothetical protein
MQARLDQAHTVDDLCLSGVFSWEDHPMAILEIIFDRGCSALPGSPDKALEDLMCAIRDNARLANFFVTKRSRMGFAPVAAATGDRIAILASGSVPLVLRPVPVDYAGEDAYRIMGGCYVEGILIRHPEILQNMLTVIGRFDARGSRTFRSRPSLQGRLGQAIYPSDIRVISPRTLLECRQRTMQESVSRTDFCAGLVPRLEVQGS